MSATVGMVAAVVLWLCLGWFGCHRCISAWYREFGDHEGIGVALPIFTFVAGPLGLVASLLVYPPRVGARLPIRFFGGARSRKTGCQCRCSRSDVYLTYCTEHAKQATRLSAPIYDATVKSQGTDPLAEADVIAAAEAITREVSA